MIDLQAERRAPADGAPQHLVILCHGLGADGRDLIEIASAWAPALPHAAFAAPHAPHPCDMAPMGRQWFSLREWTPDRLAAGVTAASPMLDAFIDAELDRLGLPPTAYALMGFSQGAMTVLYNGLRRVRPPRAILAYAGALLAPDRLAAERQNNAPVLLVHGEADDVVAPSYSRDAESTLRAAGIPVEARYTPGLGHWIDPTDLAAGVAFLRQAFTAV